MSFYDYTTQFIDGTVTEMDEFNRNVVLVVNTASRCEFAPQLVTLQRIYEDYRASGFQVLGFPCNQFAMGEPLKNEEILVRYWEDFGVSFPLSIKIDVNGKDAHPLFKYLSVAAPDSFGMKRIKWNFTKFLVDRSGVVIRRYNSRTSPDEIRSDIEALL